MINRHNWHWNLIIFLMFDCHSTHTCDESRNVAQNLNIVLYFVPSGATDITQPLDVGVFGQLQISVLKKV